MAPLDHRYPIDRLMTRMIPGGNGATVSKGFGACLAFILLIMCACSSAASPAGASSPPTAPVTGSQVSPTPSPPADSAAAVSIQGKLVFTRTTGRDEQSYHLLTAGAEKKISDAGFYCYGTRTSPDAERIIVMPGEDQPQPTPVTGGTIALDGSDYRQFTLRDAQLNLVPEAWSPDVE